MLRSMYRERPSRIGGSVVWHRDAGPAGIVRVLPDGCIDLIASDAGRLFVAGPDTIAQLYDGEGEALDAIRFGPGVAPVLLGLPASELRDQRVDLAAVWGDAAARDIADALAGAADRLHALELLAQRRLLAAPTPPDAALQLVVRELRRGRRVADAADDVGLSARQLHRRSLAAFGYGAKTLARILRFQRALARARADRPLADVAAMTGYADQAHLAREVRDLAGVPLTQLLR